MIANRSFLDLIARPQFDVRAVGRVDLDKRPKFYRSGELRTCDLVFSGELNRAIETLNDFFKDYRGWLHRETKDKSRPLNCLLLGSPGSGKSFIAETVAKSVRMDQDKPKEKPEVQELNLSLCTSPGDIVQRFSQVGRWRAELVRYRPLIVIVDEFDIKVGGVSAIQSLIAPMYNGKDAESKPLHGVAFIFTGSYLRDKRTLTRIKRAPARIDVVKLYLDLYLHERADSAQAMRARQLLSLALDFERLRSNPAPDDLVPYLRSLEKVDDFLSRINGFTLEVPDIDEPLTCTRDPFVTDANPRRVQEDPDLMQGCWPAPAVLDQIKLFAKAQESLDQIPSFRHRYDPVLRYKDMRLRERLYKALHAIWRLKVEAHADKLKGGALRIRRVDLAYLSAVPLANGMRSLESIINNSLKFKDGLCRLENLERNRKHIRETSPGAGSCHALWIQLIRKLAQYGEKAPTAKGEDVDVHGFETEFTPEEQEK